MLKSYTTLLLSGLFIWGHAHAASGTTNPPPVCCTAPNTPPQCVPCCPTKNTTTSPNCTGFNWPDNSDMGLFAQAITQRVNSLCGIFMRGIELNSTQIKPTSGSTDFGPIDNNKDCINDEICNDFYSTIVNQEIGDNRTSHDINEANLQQGSAAATWISNFMKYPFLYGYADPNDETGLYSPSSQTPGIFFIFDGTQDVCCQYGLDAGVNGCPKPEATTYCSQDIDTAASAIEQGANTCIISQPNATVGNNKSYFAKVYNKTISALLQGTPTSGLENQTELAWQGANDIKAIAYFPIKYPENMNGMLCITIKAFQSKNHLVPICQASFTPDNPQRTSAILFNSCMTMQDYYNKNCSSSADPASP